MCSVGEAKKFDADRIRYLGCATCAYLNESWDHPKCRGAKYRCFNHSRHGGACDGLATENAKEGLRGKA
jgi:hypothetical protein